MNETTKKCGDFSPHFFIFNLPKNKKSIKWTNVHSVMMYWLYATYPMCDVRTVFTALLNDLLNVYEWLWINLKWIWLSGFFLQRTTWWQRNLPNLSMHKIAKAAKISPGTIYIYFKNKEELLTQFARHIFLSFQRAMEKDHDETQSFAEQYRKMWWNIWTFLQSDPTIMSNMHQYESFGICRYLSGMGAR